MKVVGRPNLPELGDFIKYAEQIWDSRRLTNNGPLVQELERHIEDYLSVKHCVLVANGTLGLEIAAKALGLTGEVIVPSWTFVATAHAMLWIGLEPVFVDVVPGTHHLDPDLVEAAITSKTSAIMPVHVWGETGYLDDLWEIACKHGVTLFCDAAHAFGCSHHGTMIGNFGNCEVFSFHATKFFGCFEGGAITTNDPDLAQRCREMRNFGFVDYDHVVSEGTNAKMSEIHAAMGLCMLGELDEVMRANERNYGLYWDKLDNLMAYNETEKRNYQYIVVETDNRDEIVDALAETGYLARKYFYPGVHQMYPYNQESWGLPNTERLARRTLCLPTGPDVDEVDINEICEVVCRLS